MENGRVFTEDEIREMERRTIDSITAAIAELSDLRGKIAVVTGGKLALRGFTLPGFQEA